MAVGSDREHWLFSDGLRSIRLDVTGTLTRSPVRLEHRLRGLAGARPALATLQQLIGLAESGNFVASQFPRERRAARWALTLRVHDALAVGASQREIAAALFDIDAGPGWKVESLSCWSRVRRLQEAARRVGATDPRLWLSCA